MVEKEEEEEGVCYNLSFYLSLLFLLLFWKCKIDSVCMFVYFFLRWWGYKYYINIIF